MPLVFPITKWSWTTEATFEELTNDKDKCIPWADNLIVLLFHETTPTCLCVAIPARGKWEKILISMDEVNPFTITGKESAARRIRFENIIAYIIWKYHTPRDEYTLGIRQ